VPAREERRGGFRGLGDRIRGRKRTGVVA
jgi:hypothetical protein